MIIQNNLDNNNYGVFISFYTINTPYEKYLEPFKNSLEKFKLPYLIEGIESHGSWSKNTSYKSKYISDKLSEFKGRSIIWLDIDCTVNEEPILFNKNNEKKLGSIGAHLLNNKELLSGTVYFKNDDISRNICSDWVKLVKELPDKWDQKCLQRVIEKNYKNNFTYLPPEYTKIFDEESYPCQKNVKPVILHLLASRKNNPDKNSAESIKKKYEKRRGHRIKEIKRSTKPLNIELLIEVLKKTEKTEGEIIKNTKTDKRMNELEKKLKEIENEVSRENFSKRKDIINLLISINELLNKQKNL